MTLPWAKQLGCGRTTKSFCSRDLSRIEVEYLFRDAVYESLRRFGVKEGILAAWYITSDGRKVLLYLAVGNKESEVCWTEYLRHMVHRGVRIPIIVTSDGAPGLINAIGRVFPASLRVRCWYHRMGNIRSNPARGGGRGPDPRPSRPRPPHPGGRSPMAAAAIERFTDRFPSAMACLADDLEALLAYLRVPGPLDEEGAMKLVFATLIRVFDRWQRIAVPNLERQQLRLLRRELGIDPEPQSGKRGAPQEEGERGMTQADAFTGTSGLDQDRDGGCPQRRGTSSGDLPSDHATFRREP